MLIGIPLAALIFLAAHWFVAALFRHSLFRPPLVWRSPWTTKLMFFALSFVASRRE
jgi:hypothetical protein